MLSFLYLPLNLEMIMTGPNDSSLAMYMWSCTSVNTVGSKKNPGRSHTKQNMHHIESVKQHQASCPSWRLTSPSDSCGLTWTLYLFATRDQGGSLLHTSLTILHQFVHVGLVVLRPVVCGAVQWITNPYLLDLFNLRQRHFNIKTASWNFPEMDRA